MSARGRKSKPPVGSLNPVLVQIVGPILLVLLIGALVFFLIEVFYRGPHGARIRWVLGLFTIAAVLVSRISIEEGMERASIFGFALAAATFVVTMRIVDFEYGVFTLLEPVVLLGFIGVVMWSANRLTWDCTLIDDSRDVSSIGLAELVQRKIRFRFGKRNRAGKKQASADKEAVESEQPSPFNPLFLFFASSKTRNTPGLWVFYFSMAAFPIFGLGQWFAQPNEWGYRWIFCLFAIYLASGLGLLMLTSLLGLERYLRKRGAAMPVGVSTNWLALGTAVAAGMMLLVMALPSPSLSGGLENSLAFLTTWTKPTSERAIGKDGQAPGENGRGEKNDPAGQQQRERQGGQAEGEQAKGGQGNPQQGGKQSGNQSGKQSGDDRSQNRSSNDQQAKGEPKQKNGNQANSDEQGNNRRDNAQPSRDQSQQNQNQKNQNQQQGKPQDNRDRNANGGRAQPQRGNQARQNQPQRQPNQQRDANQNQPQASPAAQLGQQASLIIKLITYLVGAIVLAFVLWMFRDELAKLWASLFGAKEKRAPEPERKIEPQKPTQPQRSFTQFRNPFASGEVAKWTPAQTLSYTFAAFEAWGRDHGKPRNEDQTPHEFAKQLAEVDHSVAEAAQPLVNLLGQHLYGKSDIAAEEIGPLRVLWQAMQQKLPRSQPPANPPLAGLVTESA